MDGVLVPGGGDSLYRFCLHGTAVLSVIRNEESRNLYGLLKKIYSKRSTAAHGRSTKNLGDLVRDARKALSDIIFGILQLAELGHLDLSQGDVANALQSYVIEQVAPKRDPEETSDTPDSSPPNGD